MYVYNRCVSYPHLCMYLSMYVCMQYVCICACICVCVYYMHTVCNTYTHTHTCFFLTTFMSGGLRSLPPKDALNSSNPCPVQGLGFGCMHRPISIFLSIYLCVPVSMCLCVCVCNRLHIWHEHMMYRCTYVDTKTHNASIYIPIYTSIYTQMHRPIQYPRIMDLHMSIYVYIHMSRCIQISLCMYTFMSMQIYRCIYIYIQIDRWISNKAPMLKN